MRWRTGISQERAERIHAAYSQGVTLDGLCERFDVAKSSIHKAFTRYGLECRPRGIVPAPKPPPPVIEQRPITAFIPGWQPPRSWCGQCERRVSGAEAGQCASRFCKAKAVAA